MIFVVDEGLNTLTDYRHRRKFAAGAGEEGGKRNCHGKKGADLILKVPEGTVIKDALTEKVIADMSGDNRRQVILKGGRGGLGNRAFCHLHHAGAEVRSAGRRGHGTGGASGVEGHRGCGACGISECGEIHSFFPV